MALLTLAAWPSLGADLRGRIVNIADADSFTPLTPDNQHIKIRLAEIDAPASGQSYGYNSNQALFTDPSG